MANLGNLPLAWSIVDAGDYDGDGRSDLLWRDASGNVAIWFMNGVSVAQSAYLGSVSTAWSVQNMNVE